MILKQCNLVRRYHRHHMNLQAMEAIKKAQQQRSSSIGMADGLGEGFDAICKAVFIRLTGDSCKHLA